MSPAVLPLLGPVLTRLLCVYSRIRVPTHVSSSTRRPMRPHPRQCACTQLTHPQPRQRVHSHSSDRQTHFWPRQHARKQANASQPCKCVCVQANASAHRAKVSVCKRTHPWPHQHPHKQANTSLATPMRLPPRYTVSIFFLFVSFH